jgi:hypothetical protein
MECGKIQGMLTAYLEEAVTPEEGLLVQDHLSSCEKCRCAADDLKKTGVLLKNLEEIEPPPWLTQKIMARVRDEAEHKSGVLKWLFYPLHVKLPLQGVAAILIVGLAAFLYRAIVPQFEAAKAPLPREQVAQLQDRVATAQREEAFTRQSVPAAIDAQQHKEAPEEDSRQSYAGAQELTYAKRSMKTQDSAALALRQESPAPSPEVSQPAYAPLQKPEQPWPDSPQGASVRPRLKPKAPAPRSGGVIESKPGQVDLTVRVTDVADAAKRIERLLDEEGASRVIRESRDGKEILSAEMKSEQVDGLLQKLRSIGDIRSSPPDIQAGETVAVRIDLQDRSVVDERVR